MAITLIATPKATDANTYATEVEADAYQERHLYITAWETTSDRKKAALVWATRLLDDTYEFVGWRTTLTQKLAWPRTGVWTRDNIEVDQDTIPEFLVNAVSEQARLLLEADRTADPETKGFSEITVGPITLKIDKLDSSVDPVADSVWTMLQDYAQLVGGAGTVKLVRT